jgi:predicted Rdx family selenoprotein
MRAIQQHIGHDNDRALTSHLHGSAIITNSNQNRWLLRKTATDSGNKVIFSHESGSSLKSPNTGQGTCRAALSARQLWELNRFGGMMAANADKGNAKLPDQ